MKTSKNRLRPAHLVTAMIAGLWGYNIAMASTPPEVLTHRFAEVNTLFANPGQGWMSTDRTPSKPPRFPCSVVYLRFDWADAEPEEGKYNWKFIDDVIQAWKPYHAAVALRVMTANAHSAGYYSSPKWLFTAGCRGFEYLAGGADPTSGGALLPRIEPDYADPIYLAKHARFIDALGRRYDGNPDVEFLDIGSYGIWGEWHTTHEAPLEVRKQIVDTYLHAFSRTPLVFMTDDAATLAYAVTKGIGLRRDGVGSPWHEKAWIGSPRYVGVPHMDGQWRMAPVVFEWFGDYNYIESQKWSFPSAVKFMLDNHVTMINDNIGAFPEEARPMLENLARRAGYRFVLRSIDHARSVSRGKPLPISMNWENVGVGRLYRHFDLQIRLQNPKGKTVLTRTVSDARKWLPGPIPISNALMLPGNLEPGKYRIELAIVDANRSRNPLQLAIDLPNNAGWYPVSEIDIRR